jgi:outer membrane protein OmpA-like peptidoglycan-associated protein
MKHATLKAAATRPRRTPAAPATPRRVPPGLPRFLQPPFRRVPAAETLPLGRPDDALEQESQRFAAAHTPAGALPSLGSRRPLSAAASSVAAAAQSSGQALDPATQERHESRLGVDLSPVRVHTGPQPAALARSIGARAFTHGRDVFFGADHSPGDNELTAHELAHVVQQSGGGPGLSAAPSAIQRDLTDDFDLTNGRMRVDLRTEDGSAADGHRGLDGWIRFEPGEAAPLTNSIELVQIVKLTDLGGTDVAPGSLSADRAARGKLGEPGLLTEENADTGVEGGYFTDVQGANAPAGGPLSTGFRWSPAGPGVTGTVGDTPQPAEYGGGIGGVFGNTPGFKRSDEAQDIRSAALYDRPGIAADNVDLAFEFETVARAQDKGINLGTALWGFQIRSGVVENEHLDALDAASATFGEALERHRDFYVHEPMSFYFGFDSAVLEPAEEARIDDFMPWLARNADVSVSLAGSADQVGAGSAYNLDLSLRRARAVRDALVAHGLDPARIAPMADVNAGSTAASANAGTGDQGGDAAVGADQSREANRWVNRSVIVSFTRRAGP